MALYRIKPEKDTFINSHPSDAGTYGNAGRDEILEVGGFFDADIIGRAKRTLIQFKTTEIQEVVNSKVSGPISASLNLTLANATELPKSYTLSVFPVSASWENGLGKGDDEPKNTSGCSWKFRDAGSTEWTSLGGDFLTDGQSGSATYGIYDSHDVDIDVTGIVSQHYSASLENYGMLVKADSSVELNTTSSILLKYFSKDTNTIYKPYLQFKWDDSTYSSSLSELSTDIATIGIKNAKEKYNDSDKVRFRLSARPKYPTRAFVTSSIYLTEFRLPSSSYYGIQDETTGEMIVDFDTSFTKVSADNTSNYFDFYMNSLEPERYYRLLVKTTLNDSTIVIDNKNIFKVTKHG
tara:strand:+ start:1152 stop:2204 length:1053 start_codon:yes stop_codon:yes gene_type:complete